MMKSANSKKDQAIVFILLGQSNAVGHDLPMQEEDKIKIPLANVWGLSREHNQAYDHTELVWEGYVSAGMNVAEEQDDTYSVANCLARRWQNAIDGGADLPDLYVVHIAIGAQGVTERYMWYPDRAPVLVPGKLGTVNISLHPFTEHILSLVREYMEKIGKDARYVLHWRGGEEEGDVPVADMPDLFDIYVRLFGDYYTALGEKLPVILHRVESYQQSRDLLGEEGVARLDYINGVFDRLAETYDNISVFDPKRYPAYTPDASQYFGIFRPDHVHFLREVNEWVAGEIMAELQ